MINKFKFILFSFIIWWLSLVFIFFISNKIIAYRQGQEFTNILHTTSKSILGSSFLFPYANFDGVHYLAIAQYGYTTEAGFFPFYPLLIKTLSLFNLNYFFSGLFISNFAFIVSLIFFYKLIKLDFSDKIARQSLLFMLIFPTSFFFACIYSESLFFLLLILCFYFARKQMWLFAVISGIFLSATRIVGVLILPALLWEFYLFHKNNFKSNIQNIVSFILIPLGLISYMIFNFLHWGNLFYFIKAQGMLSNNRSTDQIILLPQTLFRYFKIISSVPAQQYEWWISLLELAITIFVMIMLYVAYKQKVRVSYLIFSLLSLLLPISSGTLSGMPRYVLVAFPVYIALVSMKNRIAKLIYSTTSIILLIILWILFSKGYYVA